ncbi:MAG TPA: hypothetical protein VNY34_01505 [Solirubrobacteraceae bacterium]|jgi:hypothetical protein|nr:hypothetical protein [Solirubrobacteraceae bacterium]
MISSEVQRTLVKSPPELWAELSDPASLGRHLGELGEIRITRIEPEHKVEWEAGDTSGTVQIKASGWGTKVTLTATRELREAQAALAEPVDGTGAADAPGEGEQVSAPLPDAAPAAPQPVGATETDGVAEAEAGPARSVEPAPAAQAGAPWQAGGQAAFAPQTPAAAWAKRVQAHEQEPDHPEETEAEPGDADEREGGRLAWIAYDAEQPVPRRGFFARLLGRRRRPEREPLEEPTLETREVPLEIGDAPLHADAVTESEEPQVPPDAPEEPQAAQDAPEEPELPAAQESHVAVDSPEPAGESAAEPASIAADPIAAEDGAKAEVTAVLTSVLDRLGAAHHRPFSRS